MSAKPRETDKPTATPQTKSAKKTETTILTPEELRAISGGATSPTGPPQTSPNGIKKN